MKRDWGRRESVLLPQIRQDAVHQGYISMTGVFIDTIVICSLRRACHCGQWNAGAEGPPGRSPERYSPS